MHRRFFSIIIIARIYLHLPVYEHEPLHDLRSFAPCSTNPAGDVAKNIKKSGVNKMANIKSAKKRILVIDKKAARNRRIKNHLKAVLKNFDAALAEGNFELAEEKLRLAEKKLMQAACKNTISKQAASRKVSRLTKKLNAAKAAK